MPLRYVVPIKGSAPLSKSRLTSSKLPANITKQKHILLNYFIYRVITHSSFSHTQNYLFLYYPNTVMICNPMNKHPEEVFILFLVPLVDSFSMSSFQNV